MLEKIYDGNQMLSIIIRYNYTNEGIIFFTEDKDSQQLGYMNRPQNYSVDPHRHNLINRQVHLTQEVLFIKSGKVRIDFYSNEQVYITSRILHSGDVILLSDGGHGLQMLEDSEIIEVKQGPYCGESDKIRFDSVHENNIKFD